MSGLYEYRVEFVDDRDAEYVETTLPPGAGEEGIREELHPDAAKVTYVGRVA